MTEDHFMKDTYVGLLLKLAEGPQCRTDSANPDDWHFVTNQIIDNHALSQTPPIGIDNGPSTDRPTPE